MEVPYGRADILRAWGQWLSQYEWEWFVTVTFRDPDDAFDPARTRVGWKGAWKTWDEFVALVDWGWFRPDAGPALQPRSWWFAGLEIQERGVPHIHALVGGSNVGTQRRVLAFKWLFREAGFSRILPYDSGKGAAWYLCKYITKELSDWKCQLPLLAPDKGGPGVV